MTVNLKINLQEIHNFITPGFKFTIPEDVCNMINYLSSQVGSNGLTSSTYIKQEHHNVIISNNDECNSVLSTKKKKKGNRATDLTEEWESIRTFQSTKIEHKTGIDGEIDNIRLLLNKLTDKTFFDIREKIIERLNNTCLEFANEDDCSKIGKYIYELCSSNKFYSKIFSDLFAELCDKYTWLMQIFDEKYNNIMSRYSDIIYIDSEKDYDGFCDMNKNNDKRRSVTAFLMNLANNGFIEKKGVVKILRNLLEMVNNMIDVAEKRSEVDELTENIAILYNKDMIAEVVDKTDDLEVFYINGHTIMETINSLANTKSKDHKSLSNKAIFKYMDLIEM